MSFHLPATRRLEVRTSAPGMRGTWYNLWPIAHVGMYSFRRKLGQIGDQEFDYEWYPMMAVVLRDRKLVTQVGHVPLPTTGHRQWEFMFEEPHPEVVWRPMEVKYSVPLAILAEATQGDSGLKIRLGTTDVSNRLPIARNKLEIMFILANLDKLWKGMGGRHIEFTPERRLDGAIIT